MQILGVDGKPLPARPGRASMLSGASQTPYDAANLYGSHVEDWNPYLWSPDGEINMYKDRITARARDLVRNDGWATAAVMRTLDNVIGPDFRPISKPDHVALRALTGNKAFDHVWADEFGQQVEANYRAWANDPGFYCDAERMLPMPGLFQVAFRHKIVDGDGLGQLHYLPQRVDVGRARYATALQVIDPDRLSNPQLNFDQQVLRGGVEVDELGAPVAYHIREAHQGDWFSEAKSVRWKRIPRETDWGRQLEPIKVEIAGARRAWKWVGGLGSLAFLVAGGLYSQWHPWADDIAKAKEARDAQLARWQDKAATDQQSNDRRLTVLEFRVGNVDGKANK
ncbi:phage portal protein [Burkholderia glumae]